MPHRDAAQRPLGGVVAETQPAVVEEARQGIPTIEAVGDRLGGLACGRELGISLAQPGFQGFDQRSAALVAQGSALYSGLSVDLALDGEQSVDAGYGLDGGRCLVEPRQVEELAPRMGPAS